MDVQSKIKELEHNLNELKRQYSVDQFNKHRQNQIETLKNFKYVVYNDSEPKPVDLSKDLLLKEYSVHMSPITGLLTLYLDYGQGGSDGTLITAPNDVFHKVHILHQTMDRQIKDLKRAYDAAQTFEEKWALTMESQKAWEEILRAK